MTPDLRRNYTLLVLALVSLTIFFIYLGRLDLFSRDEALYGEAAREMYASGDWLTPMVNGQPFYEKPPLYYWLSATSQHIFGPTPLGVRLPAALLAIVTVLLVYLTGVRVWGRHAGILAATVFALSLQIVLIGRMGIMDVPVTCLIFLCLLAYERWYRRGKPVDAVVFGFCLALAVLMKGLAGLLAPAIIVIHLLVLQNRGRLTWPAIALAFFVFSVIAAPWFVAMTAKHGAAFTSIIFVGQQLNRIVTSMQSHSGPLWYYLGIILITFFPWVTFLPAGIASAYRNRQEDDVSKQFWSTLTLVWIAVVLVGFSLIRTKLPGYVTPLFPAMALLVGVELDRRLREPGRALWIGVLIGALILGSLVSLLPYAGAVVDALIHLLPHAKIKRIDPNLAAYIRTAAAPCIVWAAGCIMMVVAAVFALRHHQRGGVLLLAVGQFIVLITVIVGIMPIASVYLGGGEAELARIARKHLPGSRVAIYEVYPEGVAFVMGQPIPLFERTSRDTLAAYLREGDTALIVPIKKMKQWQNLPTARSWDAGQYRLLEIPKQL